jgi:hypothetical protein
MGSDSEGEEEEEEEEGDEEEEEGDGCDYGEGSDEEGAAGSDGEGGEGDAAAGGALGAAKGTAKGKGKARPARGKARAPATRRLTGLLREVLEDVDMNAEGDEEIRRLLGAAKRRRVAPTTRAQKRTSEMNMYRHRRMSNERKRVNTLRRAIAPKEKQQQRGGRDAVREPPPPRAPQIGGHAAHADTLARFAEREDEGASAAAYTTFFGEWDRAHSLSRAAVTAELARFGAVGAAAGEGIRRFFMPTDDGLLASLDRVFRVAYHMGVAEVAEGATTCPVPVLASVEELRGAAAAAREDAPERRASAAPPAPEATACAAEGCGADLIVDPQHGHQCCPRCGLVPKASESAPQVTYSDIQTSSRGAAPYERIAHVSSTDPLTHSAQRRRRHSGPRRATHRQWGRRARARARAPRSAGAGAAPRGGSCCSRPRSSRARTPR